MSNFTKLNDINVNDKVEKKNNLSYLSWAWAWAEVKKYSPDANYEIVKFNGLPYVYDEKTGYMVYTKVTIEGLTHEMWLPVMDYKNKAMIDNATMFDINKTIMRCLTKNLAMHGLGLYIYAGEDLPECEEDLKPQAELVTKQQIAELQKYNTNIDGLCSYYKVKSVEQLTVAQAEQALAKKRGQYGEQ